MNRRQNKWALSTVLTLLLCLSQSSLAKSPPKAKTLFQNGQLAETKEDPITAYEDYYQAWKLEPKNLRYKTAYERLRFLAAAAHVNRGEKLLAQNDTTGPDRVPTRHGDRPQQRSGPSGYPESKG